MRSKTFLLNGFELNKKNPGQSQRTLEITDGGSENALMSAVNTDHQIWLIFVSPRLLSAVSASLSSCHWTLLGQFWGGICPGSQTSPAEWMLCRDQSQRRSGKCVPTGTFFPGFTRCWGICLGDAGVKLEAVCMCTLKVAGYTKS